MDLLFPSMRPRLEDWERRGFSPGSERGPTDRDVRAAYRRPVGKERPGQPQSDGSHLRVAAAIMRYEVFPRRFVEPLVRRPIEEGDTVGARYLLPFGFSLFFASRAVACFDGEEGGVWRTGFTYRTLAGHPELGEETFCVEKDVVSGEVQVVLQSWSRPGLWIVQVGSALARRLQRVVNEGALERLAAVASGRPQRIQIPNGTNSGVS